MNKFLKYLIPGLLVSTTVFADKVKLLNDNIRALQARVNLIEKAEKEILLEYFEIGNDEITKKGLSHLRAAAKRGVKVKILVDNMHNSMSFSQMAAVLGVYEKNDTPSNIEIKVFNSMSLNPYHLTYRNHDKLMSVDGESENPFMIVGGRNVSANYFGQAQKLNFKDTDAIISGESAKVARKYFMTLWEKNPEVSNLYIGKKNYNLMRNNCNSEESTVCEEENANRIAEVLKVKSELDWNYSEYVTNKGLFNNHLKSKNEILNEMEEVGPVLFAFNDPLKKMNKVEDKLSAQIMRFFKSAQKNILIVTPYLYPTEKELKDLEEITDKGIKVTIVTNSLGSNDMSLVHAALLTIKKRIADMGIDLYMYKSQNKAEILHVKGALVDDTVSLVGSFNFDRRSSNLNREIGVGIGSRDNEISDFSRRFKNFIENEIISHSVLVTHDKQELSTEAVDSLATEKQREELERNKGLVRILGSQI
jgi:putative cardiolipin synthase